MYRRVEEREDILRAAEMGGQRSMSNYVALKTWTRHPEKYSAFSGEANRLGFRVPERYLDDRDNLKGTRIKLLYRLAGLPLMDRVGREAGWDKDDSRCVACDAGEVVIVEHFVMSCQAYDALRTDLFTPDYGRSCPASALQTVFHCTHSSTVLTTSNS